MSDQLEKRKQDLLSFIKSYIYYILTGLAIFIGVLIRISNLPLLKDKLLLALDPFVFYRYTKYIVEHGSLMSWDTMRYVPLGYNPMGTGSLLSYVIAYLYKFINIFIPSLTLEKFNILYPVIFFIFAMIIFFLLVKKLFNIKIATLATAFLAVLPGFLYRTMAGFSEKEPIGIFFMFVAFYLYFLALSNKNIKYGITLGVLSGLFSGLLAAVWGAVDLIFIIIPTFTLIMFFIDKFSKRNFYIYISWFIATIFSVLLRGGDYTLPVIFTSYTILFANFAFLTFLIHYLIFEIGLFKIKEKLQNKFPKSITSILITMFLGIIVTSIFISPRFLIETIVNIINDLIHPMGTSRFMLTVAEAHQPYFLNWKSNFFWFFHMFFLGSILLFYKFVKPLGKEYKWFLTTMYTLFISAFIFSRYSSTSILNGENFISNFLYIGSLIFFVLTIILIKIYTFYKDKETHNKLKKLNTNYIFIFVWFLLSIIGARGAMRLFFVFCPITAILGAYFIITIFNYLIKLKIKLPYNKIIAWVFLLIVLLMPVNGSLASLTKISYNSAKYTGPSFNNQWEQAMNWVKQNTPKDAVFAHWWDYGYWVQTMGERATILDGGNAITYWNHLMGRHVLTGHSPEEALEFLKSHNATHLLIISDEIGKFPAYASIGSDENYDRYSNLPIFGSLPSDIQETRNETLYLFRGQFGLDADFTYNQQKFQRGSSFIAGFIVPVKNFQNEFEIKQPTAVVIKNGIRSDIPLECIFFNNKEIIFDNPGIKGCLQIIPKYNIQTQQVSQLSTSIYISEKVRKTLFAQLFLFNKQWPGFELVYDDSSAGGYLTYIENYGRLSGPLKIWKINYPPDIKTNPEYLRIDYPSLEIWASK